MKRRYVVGGLLAAGLAGGGVVIKNALSFKEDPAPSKRQTFMPDNTLHLEDGSFRANITNAEFDEVITRAELVYRPIVQKFGANLQIVRKWDDPTVNAYAEQSGNVWRVTMFGGMARRPEVTADGFALVLCHEIGHHLGGFPYYGDREWASNEGQSDYFASLECAKKIWPKDGYTPQPPAPAIAAKCDSVWTNDADRKHCYRVGMGGKALAELLAALNGQTIDVNGRDTRVVSKTANAHPNGQCRFDTYLAGALCQKSFNDNVIPGKGDPLGNNSSGAEAAAYQYSCPVGVGSRPRCWFAPRAGEQTPSPNPTPNPSPIPNPPPIPTPNPVPTPTPMPPRDMQCKVTVQLCAAAVPPGDSVKR